MKKTTLIMFFCLQILIYFFPAEDPRIKTFNDNFITIYLVGYWSKPDKDSFQKPRSDGQVGGEFIPQMRQIRSGDTDVKRSDTNGHAVLAKGI